MTCEARPTIDGYRCHRCGISWDRDDSRDCAQVDKPQPIYLFTVADAEAGGQGLRRLKRRAR
jgi:hypothetical protein